MQDGKKPNADEAMQRFENLLGRVIKAGKKKAEEVKEVIEETIEPEKPTPDE
jgi:predicted DNA-binding protein